MKNQNDEKPWYQAVSKKHKKIERAEKNAVSERRAKMDSGQNPRTENRGRIAKIVSRKPMFEAENLSADAKNILENFDSIIQGVRPLSAKARSLLSRDILSLSRSLTSERGGRRMGYMNDAASLTAYAHYFVWWNLVRLTRLFASLDENALSLSDGDYCLDIGSGPLTAVIALYLARPELRAKKLSWYCLDYSQSALSLGEDLFLSVASKLQENGENWKIVRVKGGLGTAIKHKAALVTCANMMNETFSDGANLEQLAKKHALSLMSYCDTGSEENRKSPYIFVSEPGVPQSARFISLLRDALISRSYGIIAPCPHFSECPMDGRKHGKNGKWCNFAFDTTDAPKKLLQLSQNAKLPKDRAVLSFVFARLGQKAPDAPLFRIASDEIRLERGKIGHYACTGAGLMLVAEKNASALSSGDLVELDLKKIDVKELSRDEKSGALIQNIGTV